LARAASTYSTTESTMHTSPTVQTTPILPVSNALMGSFAFL
jgi:hypothetical protein